MNGNHTQEFCEFGDYEFSGDLNDQFRGLRIGIDMRVVLFSESYDLGKIFPVLDGKNFSTAVLVNLDHYCFYENTKNV